MVKNFSIHRIKERRRIVAKNKLMSTFFANILIKSVTDNAPSISRHKFELFLFEKLEERAGKDFVLTSKKNLISLLLFWGCKLWSL